MTRRLEEFLPLVLPFAMRCPRMLATQCLRQAAIEWCERTYAWRHISQTQLTEQGEAIVAPEYATVHEIESAYWNNAEIAPTQFSEIEPSIVDGVSGTGRPRYVTQSAPNTVTVYPFQAGELRLTLFLKPRAGSEFGVVDGADPLQDTYNIVPEHIFIQSAEHIANGALSRILRVKDEAFYDPKAAADYEMRFERAMNRKFNRGMTGQQSAPLRTPKQWF